MYSVTVKIDGIESRRRNAGFLHIVIGIFLIAKGNRFLEYENFIPVFPVLLVAGLSLFYGFFRKKIDLLAKYNSGMRIIQVLSFVYLGFMFLGVGRSIDYIGVFVFAFLSLMFVFSERRIFNETTIFLDENGVIIPGYYKDHQLKWEELENITIREDFITLFHKKQKYLQYQVKQDLSTLEVAKLNAFCKEMIGERAENNRQ